MQTETLPAHFRLAPSSSKRWLACPGSAVADLPDESRPESEAGTIGHNAAQAWLDDPQLFKPLFLVESQVYAAVLPLLGKSRADEVALATTYYCEYVASIPGHRITETKIKHATIPDFGGTVDTIVLPTPQQPPILDIVDFKSGYWPVAIKDNSQMMSYIALARQEFPGFKTYRATIVQPRKAKAIDTAMWSAGEIDAFELLVSIAGRSKKIVAGDWCRFCPLKPGCEKGQAYSRRAGW